MRNGSSNPAIVCGDRLQLSSRTDIVLSVLRSSGGSDRVSMCEWRMKRMSCVFFLSSLSFFFKGGGGGNCTILIQKMKSDFEQEVHSNIHIDQVGKARACKTTEKRTFVGHGNANAMVM